MKSLLIRFANYILETFDTPLQSSGICPGSQMRKIILEATYPGFPIYIPDDDCKTYNKDAVLRYHGLMEVSSIHYVPEIHDCDDYAAKTFGKFAGLVWVEMPKPHALNWFIDEYYKLWFLSPQNKQVAPKYFEENPQYLFFLGR